MKKAQGQGVYKRKDGIVIIDPEKARGQKGIVDACPYGAIWWNEERNLAQKCILCAHLLDEGWKEPRCVQSCPTGALRVIYTEDSQMQKIIESENLEVYEPQYKTRPRVYYKNLYRFTRCFIGGSVGVQVDGTTDCAEGATVTLIKDSQKTTTVTDVFGDFKFDGLEEDSGTYRLEISYRDWKKKTIELGLATSLNVGTIFL
jgi:NAD-dependent dihydropyrimidine dehydrogenase PreA subunit